MSVHQSWQIARRWPTRIVVVVVCAASPLVSLVAEESPLVAAARGGDMVQVATRRGALELKARIDRAVPPGMDFIPFCYAEAPANFLTNPQLDPFGKIPEFKFCAARIQPANAPNTVA